MIQIFKSKIYFVSILAAIVALSITNVFLISAYQEECEESFYQGFDKCGMDYRSEDPHYYTQVQKNHWDRTMELKEKESKETGYLAVFGFASLAIFGFSTFI